MGKGSKPRCGVTAFRGCSIWCIRGQQWQFQEWEFHKTQSEKIRPDVKETEIQQSRGSHWCREAAGLQRLQLGLVLVPVSKNNRSGKVGAARKIMKGMESPLLWS